MRKRRPFDIMDWMTDLSSEINRTVRDALYRADLFRPSFFEPDVDILETPTEIIVKAELPGVQKKDIKLNVFEDALEISAEAHEEVGEERPGFIQRERRFGRFYRTLRLPAKVKPEEAKAKYSNGVLEIRLPKAEARKGFEVKIE